MKKCKNLNKSEDEILVKSLDMSNVRHIITWVFIVVFCVASGLLDIFIDNTIERWLNNVVIMDICQADEAEGIECFANGHSSTVILKDYRPSLAPKICKNNNTDIEINSTSVFIRYLAGDF